MLSGQLHDYYVILFKVPFGVSPFLPLLHQSKVLNSPLLPEEVCKVLHLSPPPPAVKIFSVKESKWQQWFGVQLQQVIGSQWFKVIRVTGHCCYWSIIKDGLEFTLVWSTFFTSLISLSHTPPKWAAEGGLNSHLTCWVIRVSWIFC